MGCCVHSRQALFCATFPVLKLPLTFIYLVRVNVPALMHMQRSEDNLWASILSSYHVGFRDPTRTVRLGTGKHQGKPLDSLSHVTRPEDKTKENNKMQGLAMQPAQAVLILWHSGNVLAQSLSSWHYSPVSS